MLTQIVGVVFGTVNEARLAPPQQGCTHQVNAGVIDDTTAVANSTLVVKTGSFSQL